MSIAEKEVYIDYTNWRGQRSIRRIRPIGIFFLANEWHPQTQWLVEAIDLTNDETRFFAMKDIHQWSIVPIMSKGPAGDRGQVGWMGGEFDR